MINLKALAIASKGWEKAKPFPHFVIDNFFDKDIALSLEKDFPDFDNEVWHEYGNAIEVKKVCNDTANSFDGLYAIMKKMIENTEFRENVIDIIDQTFDENSNDNEKDT